jgi:hypothetical protein
MNTAEILRAAAERVRQGWCQEVIRSARGVCAIGAIGVAGGMIRGDAECVFNAHKETLRHLQRALNLPAVTDVKNPLPFYLCTGPIGKWNDGFDQTAENVAAGLEFAAVVWEQEQAQSVGAVDPQAEAIPVGPRA